MKGTYRFDDKKRIVYYKSIDGKLELEGDHNPRKKEGVPENFQISRELIKEFFANREKSINGQLPKESENEREVWKFIGFIFEKCKNISSPLVLLQMYDEYNALHRLTKSRSGLYKRLRQNALVRVDNLKRIIEYKSNDGSLLLQGKHDLSSKTFANRNTNRKSNRRPVERPIESDDEDSEEDQSFDEDSDDDVVSDDEDFLNSSEDNKDSDEEETGDTSEKSAQVQDKKKKLSRRRISSSDDSDSNDHQSTSTAIQTSRRGRLLKKRDLDVNSSHDEVKESVLPEKSQAKKSSSVSNVNTPSRTNNKRKTIDNTADSSKRSKESTTSRADDLEDYNPNYSFNESNSMANDREHVVLNNEEEARLDGEQVKVEVFRGALQNRVNTIGDEDDDDIQEIPPPPKRVNDVPPTDDAEIKTTNASDKPRHVVPLKQEPKELVEVKREAIVEEVEAKPVLSSNRCSVLQVLLALRTLVISLDCPSFESLQKEIEEKMKHFEGSGTSIPNVEVGLAMELCFSKMNGSSFISSCESSSFIKLRDFLCYFKSFILNLKIEELKTVMEKVNGCMKECQNKIVRVKKVTKILQVTLELFTI
ncbi:hypothetical protein CAEBREN_19324 [Caenorhabditis brenneri]|uniref:SPK domain-containing protein n=1 Tax=Caenorhabditis brenneri TaxID=135651 RepID=G0NFT2_CAEBE|nr:hypothetical protein CAEBREN_19324 [Caenorhabditis brenneri]